MDWQELVLTCGQVVFILALLPSIVSKDKPALLTSVLTSLVAFSIAAVYISLMIPLAALSAAINGLVWFILAIQKYRQRMTRGK